MSNVYYDPKEFGLTVIAELSEDESYEFDMTVVWQHEDGTIYWDHDSGCSCPTPFENVRGISDLYVLATSIEELRQTVERQRVSLEDRIAFLQQVKA